MILDRNRIGFGFRPTDASSAIDVIRRAEKSGFGTAWTVMPALGRDTMSILAAAATVTSRINLGTAIVPAFTRHPIALATQAHVVEDLAPGRLRLGIGTSHQRTMISAFGFEFDRPLAQLREYTSILRTILQNGTVDFEGNWYAARATLPTVPGTPVLVSALRERAWEFAGECSDGGISWITPPSWLVQTALPALQRGADQAGRLRPPLIAHVFVSANPDRRRVLEAVRANLAYYAEAPFYQAMFAASGHPLGPGNTLPDSLLEALTISGSPEEIERGISNRLASRIDEILIDIVPEGNRREEEDAVFAMMTPFLN